MKRKAEEPKLPENPPRCGESHGRTGAGEKLDGQNLQKGKRPPAQLFGPPVCLANTPGDNAVGDQGGDGGEHGQKLLAKPRGLEDVWADHSQISTIGNCPPPPSKRLEILPPPSHEARMNVGWREKGIIEQNHALRDRTIEQKPRWFFFFNF